MSLEPVLIVTSPLPRTVPVAPPLPDGWEWLPASTPWKAQELIERYRFGIGVIDFRGSAAVNPHAGWQREIVRANRHIHWLALVPRRLLRDARFAELLSCHFFAYQADPFETSKFATLMESAHEMARLRLESRYPPRVAWLTGKSAAMRRLDEELKRGAAAGLPVLISGEVGSGKSTAARVIHDRSHGRDEAFRILRSITLPGCLLPAEETLQQGGPCRDSALIEAMAKAACGGGTLVLDEIGDLSVAAQRVLLRWLDAPPEPVQLIALTHMDLPRAVAENRFRGDLFQRLSALHIVIPPLREREDDVLGLAEHFLKADWALNRKVTRFSRPAIDAMRRHQWPGNIRELKSRIRRAMVMGDDYLVHTDDLGLPPKLAPTGAGGGTAPAAAY